MKKISILSLHLGYGGIEKSIVSLANILCEKYKVEIACVYNLYDKCVFDLDDRVKINYLNPKEIIPNRDKFKSAFGQKNFYMIFKESWFAGKVLYYRKKSIVDYIKSCDSDIIISTRDIFNNWTGKYAKNGVVKIGWEHNHYHGNMKYAKKVINSAKNLDYFVLVSSALKEFYASKLTNTKCVYIPNCIEELPKNKSNLKGKKIISVGRLSPEKGYLDLLKVYKKVIIDNPDWTLDIIGDGVDKEKLEDYISKNGLTGVTLHGYQGKDYIEKVMLESSIYLMCSHTESFGIVLIEAMSYGIPCIAFSSAEGALDIIENDKNGYLIDERNIDNMVCKVKDLIDDKNKRNKMGEYAIKSVTKYTSEVVGKEWFKLIEESDINE